MITVVIPTANRVEYLRWTLLGLFQQRGCDKFEVVIVADDDTSGIPALLKDIARSGEPAWCRIELVSSTRTLGRSGARDIGWRVGCGDYVLFLDDDSVPHSQLLASHEYLSRSDGGEICVVGVERCMTISRKDADDAPEPVCNAALGLADARGRILADSVVSAANADELLDTISWRRWHNDKWLDLIDRGAIRHPWTTVSGRHLAVTRSLLDGVGGFDWRYQGWGEEDTDLGYRLWQAGARYATVRVPVYNIVHGRDRSTEKREWLKNFQYFVEKHGRPIELLLRAQLLSGKMSYVEFETALRSPDKLDRPSVERAFEQVCSSRVGPH